MTSAGRLTDTDVTDAEAAGPAAAGATAIIEFFIPLKINKGGKLDDRAGTSTGGTTDMTTTLDSQLVQLIAAMPFAASLGIRLDAAGKDEVRGRFDWDASRCTVGGVLHGGALITFADSLGAICAFLNLPEGAGTATIESKTNLFRAVRGGQVLGTSRPLHVGRSTIVVQTDLYDERDRRVAQVTQTQSVLLPTLPAAPG